MSDLLNLSSSLLLMWQCTARAWELQWWRRKEINGIWPMTKANTRSDSDSNHQSHLVSHFCTCWHIFAHFSTMLWPTQLLFRFSFGYSWYLVRFEGFLHHKFPPWFLRTNLRSKFRSVLLWVKRPVSLCTCFMGSAALFSDILKWKEGPTRMDILHYNQIEFLKKARLKS